MIPAPGPAARPWLVAVLALGSGSVAAFAFPPFGFLPGLLGFGLMMALCDRADARRPLRSAFWRGWLAGAAFFLVSTGWVYEAFQVDAAEQGWMAPIAVAALAGGLGLFWGTAALIHRAVAPRGWARPIVFAGALMAMEWLRGHLFTGFPWNLPGEVWAAGSPPSQLAAAVGAYGLSWVTVAIAAAPALLFDPERRRGGLITCFIALIGLGGVYGYGAARLSSASKVPASGPLIRIVQANLPEVTSYDAASYAATVRAHLALTARPGAPDIVVWPERSIPGPFDGYLADGTWTQAAIIAALRSGEILITGGYRAQPAPPGPYTSDGQVYFNSLVAVRRQGDGLQRLAVYDKHRLVPFGEYLPLAQFLAPLGVEDVIHMGAGFTPGPAPRPVALGAAPPVQPLICYEALYPGFTREGARLAGRRAAWIVNVSDDAWFGGTYGPLQHLNLAAYRAIEEGLPMVRATPTGVSAMIDPYGRAPENLRLGPGRAGVIDARLPATLSPTLFDNFGETFFALMMLASAAIAALVQAERVRRK